MQLKPKKALEIVDNCIYNGKIIQEAFNYSFLYTVQEALENRYLKKLSMFLMEMVRIIQCG